MGVKRNTTDGVLVIEVGLLLRVGERGLSGYFVPDA